MWHRLQHPAQMVLSSFDLFCAFLSAPWLLLPMAFTSDSPLEDAPRAAGAEILGVYVALGCASAVTDDIRV